MGVNEDINVPSQLQEFEQAYNLPMGVNEDKSDE